MNASKYRILIVDASAPNRDYWSRGLLRYFPDEFDVTTADPENATDWCRTGSFDCVVVEHAQWEKVGLNLRSPGDPVTSHLMAATVVLTEEADETLTAKLARQGAGDWLEKEYTTPSRLRHAIRNAWEKHNLRRTIQAGHDSSEQWRVALDRFTSIISHDLSAPVRRVEGFCQLLAERCADRLDEEGREFLGFVTDEATRLQRMIHGLVAWSRLTTRQSAKQSTDCNQILQGVLSDLESTIHACGGTVTSDVLPTIVVTRSQIAELLRNLIENGLKFRGREKPIVHVGCQRQNGNWRFRVRDNGLGIDPKYADRIFEVFQRLHRDEEFEGIGMGLALCRKVVELHEGRIWVESAPGEGSDFYFELPIGSGFGVTR